MIDYLNLGKLLGIVSDWKTALLSKHRCRDDLEQLKLNSWIKTPVNNESREASNFKKIYELIAVK